MAPVPRKEGLVSSPSLRPSLRTGAWSKDTWATAGHGKDGFIFTYGKCCDRSARTSQEVTACQMDWALGRDKAERRGTGAFPHRSPAPGPSHHCMLPTPTHCEAEHCPGCGSRCPARLASGIKAPEERGHGHHEQGIEVDDTGPTWVLTDVLQPLGCCSHLLLGGGWGTACPTPAHSTEPEQALAEQARLWGWGLWEKLRPDS